MRITTGLPATTKASFQAALAASLPTNPQEDVQSSWDAFKSAIHAAIETLPISPPTHEAEWMTDELRSLSKKKKETWLRLRDATPNTQRADLKSEYQRLKKLTKVAADKARNSWWSTRAVEA